MSRNRTFSDALVIDVVCELFLVFLLTLTFLFKDSVPQSVATKLALAMMSYAIVWWVYRLLPAGNPRMIVRVLTVTLLCSFLFSQMQSLQHIFFEGWFDDALLSVESPLFGTQVTLLLQKLIHPVVTEAMMFSYVIYVPLLPLLAMVCYWSAGTRATNDYLLNLCLAYFVCYIGFMLFPIASPMYHSPELHTAPLKGGFFTWCSEWIRANQHYPGGSLPSPHCAAATVMLTMLHRYNRKWFFVALPTFLMLYISTVYGRYHYVWDGVAGILVASAVLRLSPKLVDIMSFLTNRTWSVSKPQALIFDVASEKHPTNL